MDDDPDPGSSGTADERVFGRLFAMQPLLKRALWWKHQIPEDRVEDLFQQALLELWKAPKVPRDPEAWITVTIKRLAIDWVRRQSRRHRYRDAIQAGQGETEPTRTTRYDLEGALEALPARDREVLDRIHLRGETSAQAGAAMDLSAANVRQIARRARLAIRGILGVRVTKPPRRAT
jgi:RNA polymerase sigma-70 factor (ECF subfamily)